MVISVIINITVVRRNLESNFCAWNI